MSWPSDWSEIDAAKTKRVLAEELARELSPGHQLFGLALAPVARADGRDDFLFQAPDGRVAEVHLTFANHPERPPWPGSALYDSLEAWKRAKGMEDGA